MQTQPLFTYLGYQSRPDNWAMTNVHEEISRYCKAVEKYPKSISTGYGTYIQICLDFSSYNYSNQIIWLKEFDGFPLNVEISREFYVKCEPRSFGGGDNLKELASHAFLETKQIR